MAAWLPVFKIVLPYLAPIVSAALPVFTKKKSEGIDPLVAQQIAELQEAVRINTESVKAIATAMEESALANDAAIKQARLVAGIAVVVAVVSILIAVAAWVR